VPLQEFPEFISKINLHQIIYKKVRINFLAFFYFVSKNSLIILEFSV
jgi:hypothetical protein